MLRRPLDDETERAGWQVAFQHGKIGDIDDRPVTSIPYMEVGWLMIVVEHGDNEAEEATDLGQPAPPPAGII